MEFINASFKAIPWGDDVNLLIKLKDVNKFTSSPQGIALCTEH